MMPAEASGLLGPPARADDPIRLGFQIWGQYIGWAELMAAGERVEALGFASLFANDHLMPVFGDADGLVVGPPGPIFEGWMILAGWAARTSRVPLGMLVSGVGYRNLGLTVKMATAIDHASGGRSILGLGAGWHQPENIAFGFGYPTLGERMTRLDEASRVARALLDGEAVTFEGVWVQVRGARNDPPPMAARMPLLIGSSGEKRGLRIVARDADIWNGEGDPEAFARKNAVLDEHCVAVGRDPAAIRRTAGIPPVCIRDTRAGAVEALARILQRHGRTPTEAQVWARSSPLADTEEAVAAWLRTMRAAGAEEGVIDWPLPSDEETLERLADRVRQRLG
jgi:alkanesulfonate monooxygenase SsuD/methylene tetrahydromethanopterin reductase-like flavin-dependent oxidoreductase (luciferase family)